LELASRVNYKKQEEECYLSFTLESGYLRKYIKVYIISEISPNKSFYSALLRLAQGKTQSSMQTFCHCSPKFIKIAPLCVL